MRLLRILGHLQYAEAIHVSQRRVIQVGDVLPAHHGFLDQALRQRRHGRHFARHFHGLVHQLLVRHQPLRQTDAMRLLRVERKAHGHLHGIALPDPARQAHRAAIGRQDAQPHLRRTPFGAVG